jgi:hypothetical protein
LAAIYYAVKIVRLSDKFEFVALKGGKAPYYIVLGLLFLELDRLLDLSSGYLSATFGYPLASTFNDPPAAISAIFIFLGLREMYVVYIRSSKAKKPVPSHEEIWETERAGSAA